MRLALRASLARLKAGLLKPRIRGFLSAVSCFWVGVTMDIGVNVLTTHGGWQGWLITSIAFLLSILWTHLLIEVHLSEERWRTLARMGAEALRDAQRHAAGLLYTRGPIPKEWKN